MRELKIKTRSKDRKFSVQNLNQKKKRISFYEDFQDQVQAITINRLIQLPLCSCEFSLKVNKPN